ncbi:twin-arginine translocation signal domain-containing protein [Kitasatospora sp. LaBMicrA B282]|uniref:twin-arginine translocation signal domain-containing protein n=1 Tax=Kitasatospora sp. LaBMicrA B282 TaxID=3420949 RepID=UPI003D0FDFCD
MELSAPDAQSTPLSRRRLIRGAAAAGAAGVAANLLLAADPAAAQAEHPDRPGHPEHPHPAAHPEPAPPAEPLIVHLRDARTGALDLFSGDHHRQVQDPALAAALLRALG